MASHESFSTAVAGPSPHPSSPFSSGFPPPPPPPPKPAEASRSSTPSLSAGPPIPPHPSAISSPIPDPSAASTSSPRPLPPIPHQTSSNTPAPTAGSAQPSIPSQQPYQQTLIPPPSLSDSWLPEGLSSKPITELTPLLSNPQLLSALASQHPSHASSIAPLQSAIAANLALAQEVATTEAQLSQLRDQTAQLLLNHTSLQTQWRRKQSEMDDALSPWGPRAMYQRLVSSINEQESLLKAMQESFLEGGSQDDTYYGDASGKATEKEISEWVRGIREGTTTLEKRREMRARWDEGRVGGWR